MVTETTAPAEALAALFNRVADRIETTHGTAEIRTTEPLTRGGETFMTAAWFPDRVNNGFKLFVDRALNGDPLVRVLTWAHTGALLHATATVAPKLAEETLLALLPPAIRPPSRSPLAEVQAELVHRRQQIRDGKQTNRADAQLDALNFALAAIDRAARKDLPR